jgi:hypothetical protein
MHRPFLGYLFSSLREMNMVHSTIAVFSNFISNLRVNALINEFFNFLMAIYCSLANFCRVVLRSLNALLHDHCSNYFPP